MIADIENKNPFNVLMGLLLKYYRLEKKLTSKAMALKLNSGHSLYRLMESGASPFHPSKIYLLIGLFEDLFEDEDIEFDNLSKFLIGGQYIDALVNRKKRDTSRGLTYEQALKELLDNDTVGFVKLFDKTKRLFVPDIEEKEMLYLENEKVPLELFDFLSLNNYNKPKTEQYKDEVIESILNSYSLHTEIILSMAKEFNTHPPLHISGIADKWEKDNKKKFKYLRGFYLKEDIIINEENFKAFNYDYLFEASFTEMQMLFVSDKPKEDLELDFVNKLNASREANSKKILTETEINKINIKTVKKAHLTENLKSLLKNSTGSSDDSLLAFWIFSMISGNQNGFIGFRKRDNEKDYILNLKYNEVNKRLNMFDEEWKSID